MVHPVARFANNARKFFGKFMQKVKEKVKEKSAREKSRGRVIEMYERDRAVREEGGQGTKVSFVGETYSPRRKSCTPIRKRSLSDSPKNWCLKHLDIFMCVYLRTTNSRGKRKVWSRCVLDRKSMTHARSDFEKNQITCDLFPL